MTHVSCIASTCSVKVDGTIGDTCRRQIGRARHARVPEIDLRQWNMCNVRAVMRQISDYKVT